MNWEIGMTMYYMTMYKINNSQYSDTLESVDWDDYVLHDYV